MQRLAIFGATGSIGSSTLDLVAAHPGRFRAHVLSAHRQDDKMADLAREFLPAAIVMTDGPSAQRLRERLSAIPECRSIDVLHGNDALVASARLAEVDTVVAGIVGSAGLAVTLAAAEAGKRILLANKEALVMAGELMVRAVRSSGALILPIDSEHNAIFQCLGENYHCFTAPQGVARLLLTASGGPFRTWSRSRIEAATVSEAIAHPNWSMGRKISVDSATMMNKGLELIEACWLFSMPESKIDVVVHPQSVVHSMVEFEDGSTLAQLGSPDMRTPIACALGWPERIATPVERLDWRRIRALEFEPPNHELFPSLEFARQAVKSGGPACAVLNAANEVAVEAFLQEKIRFGAIFETVKDTMDAVCGRHHGNLQTLDDLMELDGMARRHAQEKIVRLPESA